jgi:hypothetical protein
MGFLDQFGKTAGQIVDRARFEAEKFQKTSRIQGELSDIKHQLDQTLIELGQRTHDLYHAGQIQAPSMADLVRRIDQLRGEVIGKEDELQQAQAEAYAEPEPPPPGEAAPPAPGEAAPPPPGEAAPPPPTGGSDPNAMPPNFKGQDAPPPAPVAPTPQPEQPDTRTCPACSFQMPVKAVYCPNCGFRVGSSPAPPPDITP